MNNTKRNIGSIFKKLFQVGGQKDNDGDGENGEVVRSGVTSAVESNENLVKAPGTSESVGVGLQEDAIGSNNNNNQIMVASEVVVKISIRR